jgi:hypothetical protein
VDLTDVKRKKSIHPSARTDFEAELGAVARFVLDENADARATYE